MLDHGKNRPVIGAVSFFSGRDIAPSKWLCRLSILCLAWWLLNSDAPLLVLCSAQQPVQSGGISPPGHGEPLKAQHLGESGQLQQSERTVVLVDWSCGGMGVVTPCWEKAHLCSPHPVQQ